MGVREKESDLAVWTTFADKLKEMEWNAARLHFFGDVFVAVVVTAYAWALISTLR